MDSTFDEDDALLANIDENMLNAENHGVKLGNENVSSGEAPGPSTKGPRNTLSILVNSRQRGNPVLKSISNVPWEFDEIVPDFQMGSRVCALFLSLRYHNLNPNYIHERLKQLGKSFELRVLLVLVDTADPTTPLMYLTGICILADLTLMLAWSSEEAGSILEQYKVYENKPADRLMEKSEETPYDQLIQALTVIKPVNKTDAVNLLARFGTLQGITEATEYQLSQCPGFGPRKAARLYKALHQDFRKS